MFPSLIPATGNVIFALCTIRAVYYTCIKEPVGYLQNCFQEAVFISDDCELENMQCNTFQCQMFICQ